MNVISDMLFFLRPIKSNIKQAPPVYRCIQFLKVVSFPRWNSHFNPHFFLWEWCFVSIYQHWQSLINGKLFQEFAWDSIGFISLYVSINNWQITGTYFQDNCRKALCKYLNVCLSVLFFQGTSVMNISLHSYPTPCIKRGNNIVWQRNCRINEQ